MKKALASVSMLAMLTLTLPVLAGEGDWVKGEIVVNGKVTELSHVSVYFAPGPFGDETEDLCALFADAEVPVDAIPRDDSGLSKARHLLREDELHAIQLCFDVAAKKLREVNDARIFFFRSRKERWIFRDSTSCPSPGSPQSASRGQSRVVDRDTTKGSSGETGSSSGFPYLKIRL